MTWALLDWILIRSIFAFNKPGWIEFEFWVTIGRVCVVPGRKEYDVDDYKLFGLNNFYKEKLDIFWSKSFEICWDCELLLDAFLVGMGGRGGIGGIGGIAGIGGIEGIAGIGGIDGIIGV